MTTDDDRPPTTGTAIVTAGAHGVGREVVHLLARRGHDVVVGYADERVAADAVVDEVLAGGGNAVTLRADVADEHDVDRLFAETVAAFGGIDIVVHTPVFAAPDADPHPGSGPDPARRDDVAAFDTLQRAVVRSTFLVARQAVRHLRSGGRIVVVAGPATDVASPAGPGVAAGRAAVEAMTRTFAGELAGRGATATAVAVTPGPGRRGTAAEVARAVADLLDAPG